MKNLIKLIEDNFEIDQAQLLELINLELNMDWYDYINIDWGEYRLIPENLIKDLFHDETVELIEDNYLWNTDLPSFITNNIDWDWIVEECMIDWYWHHFSWYDWSEIEGYGLYLFRTN